MAATRIGISGWTYAPWRGTFYPPGWVHARELAFAARRVSSIEINGTFYSLQRPSSYAAWYRETPAEFSFAVKGPRFITHLKRLRDVVTPLANFFASGVLRLGEKLGPVLWQLPPAQRFEPERLAEFFERLPRTTREAAVLARHHDQRLKARAWLRPDGERRLRHALEVRHPSFECADFIELLRRHEVALVTADTAGKWPRTFDVTSDFVYVRLHGDRELYASGYTPAALQRWAERIRAWSRGEDAPGERLLGAGRARPGRVRLFRQRREDPRALRCDESGAPPRPRTARTFRAGGVARRATGAGTPPLARLDRRPSAAAPVLQNFGPAIAEPSTKGL